VKKIILIIIIAFAAPFCLKAQKVSDKPFKTASKIILTNDLTADDNFNLAGTALVDIDFYISQKDKDFHTLESKTILNEVPGGRDFFQVILITAKNNSIIFTTRYKSKTSLKMIRDLDKQYDFEPVQYGDSYTGGPAFANLLKLISKLKATSVIYSE
jgi:hypothetical protein